MNSSNELIIIRSDSANNVPVDEASSAALPLADDPVAVFICVPDPVKALASLAVDLDRSPHLRLRGGAGCAVGGQVQAVDREEAEAHSTDQKAHRLGAAISHYQIGRVTPSVAVIIRLSEGFDVTTDCRQEPVSHRTVIKSVLDCWLPR